MEKINYKIGFTYKEFEAGKEELKQKVKRKVRRKISNFVVKCSRFKMNGHEYNTIYILEIDFSESENVHKKRYPLGGFAQELCFDYADVAHKLLEEFCIKFNLNLSEHLNSWPKFKAILTNNKVVDFSRARLNENES